MLKYKPMLTKGLSCYEGLLVIIAREINREYKLSYSNCFRIDYLNDKKKFGDRLVIKNSDFTKNTLRFCGIGYKAIDCNKKEYFKLINSFLEKGQPVTVETDIYYCTWSEGYHKNHYDHQYMIVGIEEEERKYICIDTTMHETYYEVDFDDLLLGATKLSVFDISDKIENLDYKDILADSIENIKNDNLFHVIQQLVEDFKQVDLVEEFAEYEISAWECTLPKNIGYYLYGTVNLYTQFIEYMFIKMNFQELNEITQMLNILSRKIDTFYKCLIKYYFMNCLNDKKENLQILFEEFMNMYKEIIIKLISFKELLVKK